MMKDEEKWLKMMKKRLDDYSEPLPDNGWERLEKALPTSAPMMVVDNKRQVLLRRWTMVAAAAMLILVSSVGVWMMKSTVIDDVNNTAKAVLETLPDDLPARIEPETNHNQQTPLIRTVIEQNVVSMDRKPVAQLTIEEDNANDETSITSYHTVSEEKTDQKEDDVAIEDSESNRTLSRPSGKDKLHLPVDDKPSKSGRGWSLALSVGNTGGISSMNSGNVMQNGPTTTPQFSDKLSLTSISNGIMSIPGGSDLVFEDGVPYLREGKPDIKNIKHKQPISFGVSVRKSLPNNFSIETGVSYTLLASDVTYEGVSEEVDQKLHYVGVPLRANWNFVNNNKLTMYVSAGGAAEKCVYGKIDGEKKTVDQVQFSVMSAVGAQYNISKKVGIYVEPGVSYFFDDGSDVETIRKENPTNFTLQTGIRLTY